MYKNILVFLFVSSTAFAQITVTSNDLLGLVGNSGSVTEDSTGFIQVNTGAKGENQTWDFSSLNLQGFTTNYSFVNPNQTPFSQQFPQANLVQLQNFPEDSTVTFYGFFEVTANSVNSIGFAYADADSSFYEQGADNDMTALPLEYGNSWISVQTDTFEIDGGSIIDVDSTYTTIDGWGTVKVPAGTFDCLRLCDYNVYITIWQFGDIAYNDTTITIGYEWLTKDNFVVANIESFEGETNFNFTMAEYASVLQKAETTTSITKNLNPVPYKFDLGQNYPNPFNPQTQITYQLPFNSHVSLKVYDSMGREIKSLVDTWQTAGTYHFTFDGSDLASGIYLYRLQSATFNQVKRMILIK